jgi:indolepyruvate ferredoxin oxidoreductase alpha subunit
MGNEAIALGAMRAGVRVVAGYPGTPSSEIIETVAKHNDGSVYVEWSVNEKVGLEVAAGAAYAGARSMATMKQMGLNVASDALMSLNYVGVLGGMVVVVADDPGPISSQTEQDTRHYAKFAKMVLFDPSTPEEAYAMVADAFELSEKIGKPVFLRPTTRVCHSCATVETLEKLPTANPAGFTKDPRWVIFPRLSYANKIKMEESLPILSDELSGYKRNILTGAGTKGIATGGVSYTHVRETLANNSAKLLKVSTVPFPDKLALEFLNGLDEVLVIEELDPVIENELVRLCGLHGLSVKILGKRTKHIQNAGENTIESVGKAINAFLGIKADAQCAPLQEPPALPVRPPVMCAGCSHRASFFAVKEAAKGISAVFTGDIGCYTLGNAPPLEMVDTCLCMGGGITVAQGLRRVEPDTVHFAFIGDSTFFHMGIPGIINAVYNQTDIVVVILDNATTAMTGNQPHPGMGITMMGETVEKISIEKIVKACGISALHKVDPLDQEASKEAVRIAIGQKGVRVILFESPCIVLERGPDKASIDENACTGCRACVKKLGCPGISLNTEGKAVVDTALCAGCGLCVGVCGPKAIKMKTFNIFIAGVGGQGTVLASKLISSAAMKRGLNARTTEFIGMAQRGGNVFGHVRLGEEIFSPFVPVGGADIMIAFEPAEAVRHLAYLSEQGTLIVCDSAVNPITGSYDANVILSYLKNNVKKLVIVRGQPIKESCAKTLNVALLGAAVQSGLLPFSADDLLGVISDMPRYKEENLASFELGRRMYNETH